MCTFQDRSEYYAKIRNYMTDEEVQECAKFYNESEGWVRRCIRIKAHLATREDTLKVFQAIQDSAPSEEHIEASMAKKHKPIIIKAKGE